VRASLNWAGGGGGGVSARHAFLHALGRLRGGEIGRLRPCLSRRHNADYIESFDFFASDWIKTGLKRERLVYRHVFNERTQKRLFYGMMNAAAAAGDRAQGARRHPGDDRQPVVVPAPPDGGGGARFHPRPPRCGALLPHHMDPRRDVFPDAGAPPRARPGDRQPLAHLQDVQRLRHAGHLLQRPVRPADQPGLPVRAQDQPRGAGAGGTARRALDVEAHRFHGQPGGAEALRPS
jgi:hypothetical protein